jgi:hypothetical protein
MLTFINDAYLSNTSQPTSTVMALSQTDKVAQKPKLKNAKNGTASKRTKFTTGFTKSVIRILCNPAKKSSSYSELLMEVAKKISIIIIIIIYFGAGVY